MKLTKLICRFPEIGLPPVIIHFDGIFPHKPSISGYLYCRTPPYVSGKVVYEASTTGRQVIVFAGQRRSLVDSSVASVHTTKGCLNITEVLGCLRSLGLSQNSKLHFSFLSMIFHNFPMMSWQCMRGHDRLVMGRIELHNKKALMGGPCAWDPSYKLITTVIPS